MGAKKVSLKEYIEANCSNPLIMTMWTNYDIINERTEAEIAKDLSKRELREIMYELYHYNPPSQWTKAKLAKEAKGAYSSLSRSLQIRGIIEV